MLIKYYISHFERHAREFCTTSDHFKIARIQEHVLPLYDLTMLNIRSPQGSYRRNSLKNMYLKFQAPCHSHELDVSILEKFNYIELIK